MRTWNGMPALGRSWCIHHWIHTLPMYTDCLGCNKRRAPGSIYTVRVLETMNRYLRPQSVLFFFFFSISLLPSSSSVSLSRLSNCGGVQTRPGYTRLEMKNPTGKKLKKKRDKKRNEWRSKKGGKHIWVEEPYFKTLLAEQTFQRLFLNKIWQTRSRVDGDVGRAEFITSKKRREGFLLSTLVKGNYIHKQLLKENPAMM